MTRDQQWGCLYDETSTKNPNQEKSRENKRKPSAEARSKGISRGEGGKEENVTTHIEQSDGK